MTEIELKFLLDEERAKSLRRNLKALPLNETGVSSRTLRGIYYDTPDHALKQAGIALRVRREGRRWVQTVKAGGTITGGLMRTREVECAAPGGRLDLSLIPDAALQAEIGAVVDGAELGVVCETQMKRRASTLTLESGARVELAIDVGEILAGEVAAPFQEAELELKAGEIDALYDLTAKLFPEGGLHLSTLPKSARGYMLAETGKAQAEIAPRTARKVRLDPAMTSEIAARDVLRECFEQISANVDAVLDSTAAEGPHQLRVGLRRLRSAFGVFKPIVGHSELVRLSDEAKAIGAEVGALRDLDVVIEDLIDPAEEEHPSEPGFRALRAAIDSRRSGVRGDLRATLGGARVQAFQIDLARFIETRGWLAAEDFDQTARLAMPVRAHADRALAKRWKSVRRHARGIDHLTIDGRHELRKELKKLRYTIEFLGPLYPEKKVALFVKRLKMLQTVFGDLNDLAMAEHMLCQPDSPAARNPAAQRAVGWLLGSRAVRSEAAWSHAKELWRGLKRTGPFWG
ncbi:CHAD domain-containing protein [Tropicimonas isoalkanivorans]|uniref:Inorganic triphosphatase YgiF, contains CYTH and CHAD domains n=1 Tax=Tropicimonas isoalkanivorans TaxID=441112 RepID=A0A1I1G443_9RHOB|nr:CHAD domain-containing protein [Tropicimonas isoalkanivorans]SFC06072.1 Inorganic triphosphatase YgiF, contains CYTH and CHAD domains [Tropicimonas isoalkanivorans]